MVLWGGSLVLEYKTDKATRALILYNRLLQGEHIDKASFVLEHGINERTFDRDIENVRMFLSEIYSTEEVCFDKQTGIYYMKDARATRIDIIDTMIIAKVLLSSAAFRSDEMLGLYNTILSMLPHYDANILNSCLKKDLERYSSRNSVAIIEMLGDLFITIKDCKDIEIYWKDENGNNKQTQVAPIEIVMSENSFYLVCAKALDYKQIEYFPIESIMRFNVLKTAFAKAYKEKYYKACK